MGSNQGWQKLWIIIGIVMINGFLCFGLGNQTLGEEKAKVSEALIQGQKAGYLTEMWTWMKKNDLPNWIIFGFTAIIWPLALFVWSRIKYTNIPNLEISLFKAENKIIMNGKIYDGLLFNFVNNTGSVIYITNARLSKCSNLFKVHPDASRDIAECSHELKFLDPVQHYSLRQITLQTNQEAITCIALSDFQPEILTFKPWAIRRKIGFRKYFRLDYAAMVGNKRYLVSTKY